MHYISKTFFAILAIFLVSDLSAQPFTLDDIQPVELNFTKYKKEGEEKAKGRISINDLTQDKDTAYYFIKGLNMYAATYFSINSREADADIKVNLCKENWKKFHRSGEIKGRSLWKSDFKTEGDFGIMVVTNKKPTRYALLVWTGDEMKLDMPSVFKNADGSDAKTSGPGKKGNKNMLFIGIGVVLLAVIGVLAYKLKNKKSSGNTTA